MGRLGYVGKLSISRFNRRLHQLSDWLSNIVTLLGELFAAGEVFLIDSMPLPVRKRVRAMRCRKVCGRVFCVYCAAKKEKFFGWRLHLICTSAGVLVAFEICPASEHDLTPLHELSFAVPVGANLFGDKGYLSQSDSATLITETGVRLVTPKRKNMPPNSWADDLALYRKRIETVYSQRAAMGIQQLHARTNIGFDLKAWVSLLALAFTNIIN